MQLSEEQMLEYDKLLAELAQKKKEQNTKAILATLIQYAAQLAVKTFGEKTVKNTDSITVLTDKLEKLEQVLTAHREKDFVVLGKQLREANESIKKQLADIVANHEKLASTSSKKIATTYQFADDQIASLRNSINDALSAISKNLSDIRVKMPKKVVVTAGEGISVETVETAEEIAYRVNNTRTGGVVRVAPQADANTGSYATVAGMKTGQAVVSGGNKQLGIPETYFTSQSTSALVVNRCRYMPFMNAYQKVITDYVLEVTTAPAGAANLRVGIYALDSSMQPTGAPLFDSGDIAVAGGFTGLKTGSVNITLPAGSYALCINTDTVMTLRSLISGTRVIGESIGTAALTARLDAVQTYGAFPATGTPWTTVVTSTAAQQNLILLKWTE